MTSGKSSCENDETWFFGVYISPVPLQKRPQKRPRSDTDTSISDPLWSTTHFQAKAAHVLTFAMVHTGNHAALNIVETSKVVSNWKRYMLPNVRAACIPTLASTSSCVALSPCSDWQHAIASDAQAHQASKSLFLIKRIDIIRQCLHIWICLGDSAEEHRACPDHLGFQQQRRLFSDNLENPDLHSPDNLTSNKNIPVATSPSRQRKNVPTSRSQAPLQHNDRGEWGVQKPRCVQSHRRRTFSYQQTMDGNVA